MGRATTTAAPKGIRVNFKATESQFATLAERLPHLVWSTRADGFCDYFNGRWYEFTGLSAEQSLGNAWRSAVHPDDQAAVDAIWREALAQGTPFEIEYRLRSASGRYCWVLARGLPDRDPEGAIVRWFGTCTMIEAQKQAETCLRVLEEQYRLALDAAKLGTWRIDIDTQIISWDEGSCALFGLPAEGLRSIPLEEALQRIHPEDRESVREKIAAAIAPGSSGLYDVECRTLLKGGSVRWTRSNGRVLWSEQGSGSRIEGLSGVIGDITDMRSAAEAQDLLTRELTHRVKNLFAIANGMVSMTARTAKDTKEMATALRGRLGALSRAHELVQPPVAHIPSGVSRVGLDQLIEAVLAPYQQEAGAKVNYRGPMVSVGSNTTTSLALVLHELATNAAKYGSLSSPEGQLEIAWTESEGSVHLVWRETGGPRISGAPEFEGFGSQLAQRSITGQLGGVLDRQWRTEGLCVSMSLPIDRLST